MKKTKTAETLQCLLSILHANVARDVQHTETHNVHIQICLKNERLLVKEQKRKTSFKFSRFCCC
jgi:hypothetical protein